MRVNPVAWSCNKLEEVLNEARKSAEVTHNHPARIVGAQAIALAIFMARNNFSKDEIKQEILNRFDYDLSIDLDEIQLESEFNETCPGSVT